MTSTEITKIYFENVFHCVLYSGYYQLDDIIHDTNYS
jgi:hypothetical protein